LTPAHYDELRAQGLDDGEIYEIISTANLFTQVNQYTDAIALEVDAL
jgi:alkylhydroperoxidase family enzyme